MTCTGDSMNAPPSPPPSQPWKSMELHQTISLRNPHQCPQKRYLSKFNRTWLSFFKDSWNTIPFSIFLKNVFIIYYYLFFSGKCLLRGRGSKWIVWFMHMWKKLYIIQIFQNLDNVDNVYDYFPARSWKIQVQNVMFMTLANSSIKPHTILKNVTNSWSGLLLSTLPLQGFTDGACCSVTFPNVLSWFTRLKSSLFGHALSCDTDTHWMIFYRYIFGSL